MLLQVRQRGKQKAGKRDDRSGRHVGRGLTTSGLTSSIRPVPVLRQRRRATIERLNTELFKHATTRLRGGPDHCRAPDAYACYKNPYQMESAVPGKLTRKWLVIAALGFALPTLPCIAQAWELVTPGEEARDRAAPHAPAPPNTPSPPTIHIVRPDLSRSLRNPVDIELRFSAGPGRRIDMRSFRATYGWLGLNITDRLLRHAVVGANSLSATNVTLPTGNHRITLSIADNVGKTASRTFRFSVAR